MDFFLNFPLLSRGFEKFQRNKWRVQNSITDISKGGLSKFHDDKKKDWEKII